MNLSHLIATYGYWVLFLLVAAESLGVPLPGETALIIAGTYAGHTHRMNPWVIWAVASAAAIIGDNIGYWLGDQGGYRLAVRYGPKVHLDERKLKTARYLFDRHGVPVVFFGRFVSVLRTYAAFLAGVSKMRWRVFLPANAAGGIVWAGIYTLASYLAGDALQRADKTISYILGGLAIIAFVAVVLVVRRQFNRLAERAEAAYPGPLEEPPEHRPRGPGGPRGRDEPHQDGRHQDDRRRGDVPGTPPRQSDPGPGEAGLPRRQPPNVTSMVRSSVPRMMFSEIGPADPAACSASNRSSGSRTGRPPAATIRSPWASPARAAGLSSSTPRMSTPSASGRPTERRSRRAT